MAGNTAQVYTTLSGDFPLRPAGGAVDQTPPLAFSLDQRLVDVVNGFDLASVESVLNPLKVEELLQSCLTRVSNCLLLREKAHDVQIRAFLSAIENKYERLRVTNQVDLDALESGVDTPATAALRTALKKATTDPLDYKKTMAEEIGHGSNYTERFTFLKEMFDLNLLQAIARAKQAHKGLKQIYDIVTPLPNVTANGYLNALTKWAQQVSDSLDVELDRRRWRKVSVALAAPDDAAPTAQIFTKTAFGAARGAGGFDFELKADFLAARGLIKPLLREIQLQVLTDQPAITRQWQCTVTPPANPLIAGSIAFPCTAVSGDASAADQFAISGDVHNFSPIGQWDIRLPLTTITGEGAAITNVILNLVVSSRRA